MSYGKSSSIDYLCSVGCRLSCRGNFLLSARNFVVLICFIRSQNMYNELYFPKIVKCSFSNVSQLGKLSSEEKGYYFYYFSLKTLITENLVLDNHYLFLKTQKCVSFLVWSNNNDSSAFRLRTMLTSNWFLFFSVISHYCLLTSLILIFFFFICYR